MDDDASLGRIGPGAMNMPAPAGGIAGNRGVCIGGGERERACTNDSCDRQSDGCFHKVSPLIRIQERDGNALAKSKFPCRSCPSH
jgi:hypothetical protein